jgi:hypothetical protein
VGILVFSKSIADVFVLVVVLTILLTEDLQASLSASGR